MEQQGLLTSQQVADMFAVTERTITAMASRRELPAVRVGKKLWRFTRTDVVAYIERQRRDAGAEETLEG